VIAACIRSVTQCLILFCLSMCTSTVSAQSAVTETRHAIYSAHGGGEYESLGTPARLEGICEASSTNIHAPKALSCVQIGSTPRMQVRVEPLAAAQGGGQPRAFGEVQTSSSGNYRGSRSSGYASVSFYIEVKPTIMGQLLLLDGVDHFVPLDVHWTVGWSLSGSGATALSIMRIWGYTPHEQFTLLNLELCNSDLTASACDYAGGNATDGSQSGEDTFYAQIRREPAAAIELTFEAAGICMAPHTGTQLLLSHQCRAMSYAQTAAPTQRDAVPTGTLLMLPRLDTSVPPESYGLPPGANVNDYFELSYSANVMPGWEAPVFVAGFED
jgi:hypothetical protein